MLKIFFYESEGYFYPTTAGTILLVILALAALLFAGTFFGKEKRKQFLSTKQLTICAMCLALAFITSFIHFFDLPYGGSVTACSMMFVCIIGYLYGVKTGLLTGFTYSILCFLQGPYILTPFQVCCDYFFAFTALGLSGLFCYKRFGKKGLYIGYIVGVFARGLFHTIGGYLYWMEYMPENFPKSLAAVYPIVYNYSYILAEAVITIIVLVILDRTKVIAQLRKLACD
ncbi:MAG: energy-coupled thiamine transporter ThiT [Lachnospiraceae bacterium]